VLATRAPSPAAKGRIAMTTKKTPTPADLDALMPAIEALARATPFGHAQVCRDEGSTEIRIELDMPGTNAMTVRAFERYRGEWVVEASGWSWTITSADNLRLTAGVLATAHALTTLLGSIG